VSQCWNGSFVIDRHKRAAFTRRACASRFVLWFRTSPQTNDEHLGKSENRKTVNTAEIAVAAHQRCVQRQCGRRHPEAVLIQGKPAALTSYLNGSVEITGGFQKTGSHDSAPNNWRAFASRSMRRLPSATLAIPNRISPRTIVHVTRRSSSGTLESHFSIRGLALIRSLMAFVSSRINHLLDS